MFKRDMTLEWSAAAKRLQDEALSWQSAASTLSTERDKANVRVGDLENMVQGLRAELQLSSDEAAAARAQLAAAPADMQHQRAPF